MSVHVLSPVLFFFFFNDTATTEIYTLSLHDALPISVRDHPRNRSLADCMRRCPTTTRSPWLRWTPPLARSEEHTSELQSHLNLVCRLLLEKKKKKASRRLTVPPTPPTNLSTCCIAWA